MLQVSHLRKEFDTVLAVDDVSFAVQRGEIFGLLGPNGAGKTTTIRVILNILEADGGETLYEGRKFSDRTRDILGYMPEERGLYKKSKVLDTILYFAELRGVSRGKAKAEAYRWLKRFSLLDYAERKVEELSKGNQQKVQFITAVLHGPELLVLDEPFSGLDPLNQNEFKDIFLELKKEGRAIIFSTHQMEQAEKLSDSLCLINKGRVVLGGSVRDVKRRYGTNSLHVEFEGEGSFLNTLPGVSRAIIDTNSAELELSRDAKTQVILSAMVGRLELRKFELMEPSLQSIFIQVVGGAPAPQHVEAS
jgi:ABC-2 type transport system ATP-binding protein